jgi:hypothetical protein
MNTRDLLEIVINEYKNVKFEKLNINELVVVMDKLNNVYENRFYRYTMGDNGTFIYAINNDAINVKFYKKYESQALRYNYLKDKTLRLMDKIYHSLLIKKQCEKKKIIDIFINNNDFFEINQLNTSEQLIEASLKECQVIR